MNMSEYEKNFEKFVLDNNFDWMPIEQKQVKNFDDLSDIVQFPSVICGHIVAPPKKF